MQQAIAFSRDFLPAGNYTSRKIAIGGLSINGMVLFLTTVAVVGSGFRSLRPEIMGLSLHPYLGAIVMAFPYVLLTRIADFPVRILAALATFSAMYFISVCNGTSIQFGEIFKVASTGITIVTCALLVRRRGDFVAGALGLSIAVALFAARGLQGGSSGGMEVIDGTNKNSYSLFALPALLLAGYIVLHLKTTPYFFKAILLACSLPTLVVIFMGGNRSGYVGALVIGLMLFWDRRGKGLLLVGILAVGVAYWISYYGSTVVLDERIKQTVEGNSSDNLRLAILAACLKIGLSNPLIGISPELLPWEISRNITSAHHNNALDSHNVYAHIFAGSGVICFAAMIAVGWTMWFWKPRAGGKTNGKDDSLRDALKLLRMMVVLWAVRGFFAREVLYSPAFNIGLGLAIGFCMLVETTRNSDALSGPKIAGNS